MREAHDFDLQWEGRRCVVHDLGALAARQVARRLANVVGTAIRESAVGAGLNADVMVAGGIAMGAILERLDDNTIEWLTQTFAKQTQIEQEPGSETWVASKDVSELAFGGGEGLARWFRWLAFCLEITCADFFRAAFSEIARLQTKGKAATSNGARPSPLSSPSSGTFTESP